MTPEEILIPLASMAPAFMEQVGMFLDTNPRTESFISTEVTDQFVISLLPRETQEEK